MSLFGAMFSGVSGLTAQSSAMGAVSDNITNVSTIGYKNTDVNFQTLVTKQVSATFYSAGGVQSKPRQRTEVQGLLQASTSQTDIAISGQGFFVVNEAARPTNTDQFLYTRAGSFIMDNEGYLKNTSGYYLQGWPTDAAGVVQAVDPIANPIPNQNIVSTDYLQTINLSRVGGTAQATTRIAIGANLPANATTYNPILGAAQDGYQKTDVQFFDTLGNAGTFSVTYMRSPRANQWDIDIVPPSGTAVMTLFDSTPLTPRVYDSKGQLEFTARPADGATVEIDGITYEFDSNGAWNAANTRVNIGTSTNLSSDVQTLLDTVKATDPDYADVTSGGVTITNSRITLSPNSPTALLFHEDGTGEISVDPVGLLDAAGNPVTKQTSAFEVEKQHADYTDYTQLTFGGPPENGDTITVNGITYTFVDGVPGTATEIRRNAPATLGSIMNDLAAAIAANDPNSPAAPSMRATPAAWSASAAPGVDNDTWYSAHCQRALRSVIRLQHCEGTGRHVPSLDPRQHRQHRLRHSLRRRWPARAGQRRPNRDPGLRQRRRRHERRARQQPAYRHGLRNPRRGRRHDPVRRFLHPGLHPAERLALRHLRRRLHLARGPGHRPLRQRRDPQHLQGPDRHLRQPQRARGPHRQHLERHRGVGRLHAAHRRLRPRRRRHPGRARSFHRRHRRGVHQDDRRPARLFRQHQDHPHRRRNAR